MCFCFVLFSFAIISLKKIGGYYPCCYVVSLFACILMSLLRGAVGGSVIALFPDQTTLAIWATRNVIVLIILIIRDWSDLITSMIFTVPKAQWLSGRVLDSRSRGCGFEPHRRHCVVSLSKNINPSLVLVQPRNTRPFITERLLMGHKKSNQTKKQTNKKKNSAKRVDSWRG